MKLNPKSSPRVPAGPGHHPGLAMVGQGRSARPRPRCWPSPCQDGPDPTLLCRNEKAKIPFIYICTHTLYSLLCSSTNHDISQNEVPYWRFYRHKMGCGTGHIVPAEGQGSRKPCPAVFSPPLPLTTLPLSSRGLLGILSLQGSQLNSSLGHANICQCETRQMGSLKGGLTVKHPSAPNP